MKRQQNFKLPQLFLISLLITGILFLADIIISNRLSTNDARIVCSIIFGLCALPLFILGVMESLKMKVSAWAALNILVIIGIIGWTLWLILVLYAFKNFQPVLPN